jgi:hypothetical protein
MRKKYKTWIQQLSESYISQALREAQQPPPMFPPGGDPSPQPTLPPSGPPPSGPPMEPSGPRPLPPTATMSGTPSDATPTPNNGPKLETIKKGERITQPAKGFVYQENGVIYTYYPGPPAVLVISQNGQSVTYFWGQNGWVTN